MLPFDPTHLIACGGNLTGTKLKLLYFIFSMFISYAAITSRLKL